MNCKLFISVIAILISGCDDSQHKKLNTYIDGTALYYNKNTTYVIARIANRKKFNGLSSLRTSDSFAGFHVFKLKKNGLVNFFVSHFHKAHWIDDFPLNVKVIDGKTYLRSGLDTIYNINIDNRRIKEVHLSKKNEQENKVIKWVSKINNSDKPYIPAQKINIKLDGKVITTVIKENNSFCNINFSINNHKYIMKNTRLLWYGSYKKSIWLLFLSNLENFQGFTLFTYKNGDVVHKSEFPYINHFPPNYNNIFFVKNYNNTVAISYWDNNSFSLIISIDGKMEKVLISKYNSDSGFVDNLFINRKHLAFFLKNAADVQQVPCEKRTNIR